MVDFNKYDVVITTSGMKKNILNSYTLNKDIHKFKIYTLSEFLNKYLYSYKNDTLLFICNKYNLIPAVGECLLNFLYYINDYTISDRLNNLFDIKKDLIDNGYIINNDLFNKFLDNKKILIYNLRAIDNFYLNELSNLDITVLNDEINNKKIDAYEFNYIEDEVVFVASKIVDLINNGVDINNIKLVLFSEYNSVINRIFNLFNIPFSLNNKNKIISYDITKYFLELLDDCDNINDIISIIRESYDLNDEVNSNIYNKIINIINDYGNYSLDRVKDIIKYKIKRETINLKKYKNVVNVIDFDNYDYNDSDYVFILGFNHLNIPIIYKDDDYLSDSEKVVLNMDTSLIKNKKEEENIIYYLNKINNLYITYKLNTPFNEYNKSNLLEKLNINVLNYNYDFSDLNYNNYLMCNMLDNLIKYNKENENLDLVYKDNIYMTYDNSFTGIDKDILYKYLDKKLKLSYSSMELFNKCQFRYLLSNILKIDSTKEDTNSIIVGKIVHQVLCRIYKEKTRDYEKIIEEEISKFYECNLTFKDKFYSIKYKEEILKLIKILESQNDRCSMDQILCEEKFEVDVSSIIDIKIIGFIDKVLIFNDNDSMYVVVIDYKTGTIHSDFNTVIYGLNMQLLIYFYLLRSKYKDIKLGGLYWQNIVKEVLNSEPNKSYDEVLENSYKLDGYTTTHLDRLEKIDSNYLDSYIKGIRLKSDNTFYSNSKVLSDSDISSLMNIVEKNINHVIECILDSDFKINPKKIGNSEEITGCMYCEFRDICYRRKNDIVNLEKKVLSDFLVVNND